MVIPFFCLQRARVMTGMPTTTNAAMIFSNVYEIYAAINPSIKGADSDNHASTTKTTEYV